MTGVSRSNDVGIEDLGPTRPPSGVGSLLPSRSAIYTTSLFIVSVGAETVGLYIWLVLLRTNEPALAYAAVCTLALGFSVDRVCQVTAARIVAAPPNKGIMSPYTPTGIRIGMQAVVVVIEIAAWTVWWLLADVDYGWEKSWGGYDWVTSFRDSTHPLFFGGAILAVASLVKHVFEVVQATEQRAAVYLKRQTALKVFLALVIAVGAALLLSFVRTGQDRIAVLLLGACLAFERWAIAHVCRPRQTQREWLQLLER